MDLADSLVLNPMKNTYSIFIKITEGWLVATFKIIYKVEGNIVFITDFFDSRQDPTKMKG